MEFEQLRFTPMRKEDIPSLTQIMKRSFDHDARLFFQKPEGGPPGYDDGSFLEKWGFHPEATAYRIDLDGTPIGAIILFVHEEHGSGYLGSIFIDPDLSGNGYGTTAWRFAEHLYPTVKTWYAETPAVSYRNHYFYTNKSLSRNKTCADRAVRFYARQGVSSQAGCRPARKNNEVWRKICKQYACELFWDRL